MVYSAIRLYCTLDDNIDNVCCHVDSCTIIYLYSLLFKAYQFMDILANASNISPSVGLRYTVCSTAMFLQYRIRRMLGRDQCTGVYAWLRKNFTIVRTTVILKSNISNSYRELSLM